MHLVVIVPFNPIPTCGTLLGRNGFPSEAAMWLSLAAAQPAGEDARKALPGLRERLSPAQWRKAQDMTGRWRPRPPAGGIDAGREKRGCENG
jgi:hypothetical protein